MKEHSDFWGWRSDFRRRTDRLSVFSWFSRRKNRGAAWLLLSQASSGRMFRTVWLLESRKDEPRVPREEVKRQLQSKGMLNVWLLGDYCAFYGRARRAHPTRKFTLCRTPERPFKRERCCSVSNSGHGALLFPYPKIIVAWGDRPPCAIAPDVTIARLIFGKRHRAVSWLWVILIPRPPNLV